MDRSHLKELHCIMPIENMASVMDIGILSNERAKGVPHESVANQEIQERRESVLVPPDDRPLHRYANLYLTARNPMMYLRKESHEELCVLSVSTEVLDLPGSVVTDKNASADFVRFEPAPEGLEIVERALTFATYWGQSDDDYFAYIRKKQAKQAEVLVPDVVEPSYIKGAYVSCEASWSRLQSLVPSCSCRCRKRLFFR